jgi:hypothetical protein
MKASELNRKGISAKIKRLNFFHLAIVFCILYALYFYAAVIVSIFRWLRHH